VRPENGASADVCIYRVGKDSEEEGWARHWPAVRPCASGRGRPGRRLVEPGGSVHDMIATNPQSKNDATHWKQTSATRADRHTFALRRPDQGRRPERPTGAEGSLLWLCELGDSRIVRHNFCQLAYSAPWCAL